MRKAVYRTLNGVSARREMTGKVVFLSLAAFVLVGALGFISRAAAPDPSVMKTLREADTARATVMNTVSAPSAPVAVRANVPVRALQARGSGVQATPTSAPVQLAPASLRSSQVADAAREAETASGIKKEDIKDDPAPGPD